MTKAHKIDYSAQQHLVITEARIRGLGTADEVLLLTLCHVTSLDGREYDDGTRHYVRVPTNVPEEPKVLANLLACSPELATAIAGKNMSEIRRTIVTEVMTKIDAFDLIGTVCECRLVPGNIAPDGRRYPDSVFMNRAINRSYGVDQLDAILARTDLTKETAADDTVPDMAKAV